MIGNRVKGKQISIYPKITDKVLNRGELALAVLAEQASRDMDSFIKSYVMSKMTCCGDLSWRDMQVLFNVLHFSNGVTPAYLSYVTRFDPATVLRANLKLADGGYIEISEHKVDGRSHSVYITEKGSEAVTHLIETYTREQNRIVPNIIPHLDESQAKLIFSTCIKTQARAEQLSLVLPSGKVRKNTGNHYSGRFYSRPFEEFKKRPELILHTFFYQTNADYLKFFKAHVISKMSTAKVMNIRELRSLMALQYIGSEATAMDVANILRFDPATVSRAVSALLKKGFIQESHRGVSDERKKPLALAQQGHMVAQEYLGRVEKSLAFADKCLGQTVSSEDMKQRLTVLSLTRDRMAQFASGKNSNLQFGNDYGRSVVA